MFLFVILSTSRWPQQFSSVKTPTYIIEILIHLDCVVDAFAFSDASSFLAIGDHLSTVHIVHMSSKQIIFSQCLHPITPSETITGFQHVQFIPGSDINLEELIVVQKNNVAMKFSNLNLARLAQAVIGGGGTLEMDDRKTEIKEVACCNHDFNFSCEMLLRWKY